MSIFKTITLTTLATMFVASTTAQTDRTVNETLDLATEGNSNSQIAIENILTRTSVRKFKAQAVEDAKIEILLRAGMAAPTSGDKRPWHMVVLKDKADIETYAASNKRHADDIRQTPLFIFVCADTTRMTQGMGRDIWVQDLSAASENILLAAHAMGLGACWTTVYPIEKKIKGISSTLNLPGNLIPLNCIIVGYPAEAVTPKDKWDPSKVTYGIPKSE